MWEFELDAEPRGGTVGRGHRIIQPLVVRRHEGRLQLVAGERRLRAARLAGLDAAPVVVQSIPDERLLEIILIENLQREDLNPIEAAVAFDRLANELHMSPEELGLRTGKDRSTIVNLVRLLQLPGEVQELVAERKLSAGHARPLLALPTAALRRGRWRSGRWRGGGRLGMWSGWRNG